MPIINPNFKWFLFVFAIAKMPYNNLRTAEIWV
jgi:hypothetical protein